MSTRHVLRGLYVQTILLLNAHPLMELLTPKSTVQTATTEPEEISLNIVLWSTQALFESRSALPEKTFERILDSGKKVLRQTQTDANVR